MSVNKIVGKLESLMLRDSDYECDSDFQMSFEYIFNVSKEVTIFFNDRNIEAEISLIHALQIDNQHSETIDTIIGIFDSSDEYIEAYKEFPQKDVTTILILVNKNVLHDDLLEWYKKLPIFESKIKS